MPIEGTIVSCKWGLKTQQPKVCLVRFDNVDYVSEAGQLIGRQVAWSSNERKIIGRIVLLDGKNGLVRVQFRKGLPDGAPRSRFRINC